MGDRQTHEVNAVRDLFHASLPIQMQEPDALGLMESWAFPKFITLQVYRPVGHPQYAT